MAPSTIAVTIAPVRAPFSPLQYQDKGRLPAVKQQIIDMTLNGSGVRDIVRVLRFSSATVITVRKKKEPAVKHVNAKLLHTLDPEHGGIVLRQVEHAEMDKTWSFVRSKSQQRWCGTREIIARARAEPMSLAHARMRHFYH